VIGLYKSYEAYLRPLEEVRRVLAEKHPRKEG